MLKRLSSCVLLLLASSCSADQGPKPSPSSAPPSSVSPSSIAQPADAQPAKEAPVPKTHVQWILNFADGSGNQYTITSDAADANAHLVYKPMTQEESSSGTYSGGSPADIQISAENTSELWRRVGALQDDPSQHSETRSMGTGTFRTKNAEGEAQFLIRMGAKLNDFTSFLSSLRPTD